MVRAFGMNPKIGGSSPPLDRDIFCLKNFNTFPRTYVLGRKWMLLQVRS